MALKDSLVLVLFLGGIIIVIGALSQSLTEVLLGLVMILIGLHWYHRTKDERRKSLQ